MLAHVRSGGQGRGEYAKYVNPQWVRLLETLEMNVTYERCAGTELWTSGGRRVLDFLSGYCVHNVGHNHPHVVAALHEELDRHGPAMLQSHAPGLAGSLAERLCKLAGGGLEKVFFCSSGSEGVEAAIKFARAHTGRAGLIHSQHSFHGLTCGALSLMDDAFWREGFGPLLQDTAAVPFGDLQALEEKLRWRKAAAFIVEPVQSEAGICLPPEGYLEQAEALCRKYGTLFVLDEVQTGMFRTGRFLAAQHYQVEPDIVILAKALSGGLVPVGAVLMRDEIYQSVYGSLRRAIVHTSTFSENHLAMRAGLATLDVLERENLGERAASRGAYLRAKLQERLAGFEMVREVRGLGLLNGIEFAAPQRLGLKVPYEAFRKIHPAMFGQLVVMHLFRDHGILTQICGNNFQTLKAAPPLVVQEGELDAFADAAAEVVHKIHHSPAFWTQALGMARRVVNV